MQPAPIDPQMQAVLTKNKETVPDPLDVCTAPIDAVRKQYMAGRAFWNEVGPDLPSVKDYQVSAPAGPLTVRLYRPGTDGQSLPVLLYCHGGGFVYGNLDSHDNICRQIAHRSGWAVLAIDYHLAPEHKFPTPLEDVHGVIDWLNDEASALGLDQTRVAMGGDSAGASITVGVAVELRDTRPDYLKKMILIYGNHGLGADCQSVKLYGGEAYGLSDRTRAFYRGSYYGDPEVNAADPRNAHLSADLTGLPPAFLGAAELDPLRDNSPAMAEALSAAGIAARCKIYPGMMHGFLHYTRYCDQSNAAHDDIAAALNADQI